MNKAKWEVVKISKGCKFYKLIRNGTRLATIEFSTGKLYKYEVSFPFDVIEDNLSKIEGFKCLAEAKKYVAETLGGCNE